MRSRARAARATVPGADDGGSTDAGPPDSGSCCPPACQFGCSETDCRCLDPVPSNGIPRSWITDPAVTDAFPALQPVECAACFFNTVTGQIIVVDEDWNELAEYRPEGRGVVNGVRFEVVGQGAAYPCAPEIGVFAFASVTVPSGTRIDFGGANAAAIVTAGDFVVESAGRVAVSAWYAAGGSGGGAGGAGGTLAAGRSGSIGEGCGGGGGGLSAGDTHDPGGGGGGFGGEGGGGGSATGSISAVAGTGGIPYGTADLVPLLGGSGGGGGSGDDDEVPAGGDGGGGAGQAERVAARRRARG